MKPILQPTLRTFAAVAIATLVSAVQVCPAPAPAVSRAAAGKLTPSEVTHTAGEILRGETVSHTFVLTNTSAGDVTINEIRACCTCATAAVKIGGKALSMDETKACKQLGTLKPGERAELALTLDTLDPGCGGKDGPITKAVNVYHTDASASPLSLSIAGNLVTPFTIEPVRLDLGTVRQGDSAKASCVVSGDLLGDFKVERATCGRADLADVTVARNQGHGPIVSYRVEVVLRKTAEVGQYQSSATLRLDHPRVRAIVIPIAANVRAPPGQR